MTNQQQQQPRNNNTMKNILYLLLFILFLLACFFGYKKFLAGNNEGYADQTELTTQNIGQTPATIPATAGPAKPSKKTGNPLKGKEIYNHNKKTLTIVQSDSAQFAQNLPAGWTLIQKPR